MIKKRYGLVISTLAMSLSGCYLPQNFDNQVQVSRTGQYQVDVDTDVVNAIFVATQNEQKSGKPASAKNMKDLLAECEKEFNEVVASDAKNGKHIVSSKYLGECKGHLTLKYTGNIITEKEFNASMGSRKAGLFIPVAMAYDAKAKQITIEGRTKGDKSAADRMVGLINYNGKLGVKTDGKVISTNSDSKPYWGLIGSYKWSIKDSHTPDAKMVIATTGI